MAINAIITIAGNYTLNDDGILGNSTSTIRDGNGVSLFPFLHPADEFSLTASAVGVNVTVDFSDNFGFANVTFGNLTSAAASFDNLYIDSLVTGGTATLVSNGVIAESGVDSGTDVIAAILQASAVSGIGVNNDLETQAVYLEAETTTGGIHIRNLGDVVIGGNSADINGLTVADSGDIVFSNFGTIYLAGAAGTVQSVKGGSLSGDVVLSAWGANADIVATTNLDAVAASRGNIFLTAGRDIAFGAGTNFDNDVRASGSLTVNAFRDFSVDGFADLTSDDYGQGTGGNLVINAGGNIIINNAYGEDGSLFANGSAGADVILTTGILGAFGLYAAYANAVQSNSGDVIINADQITIAAASGIVASNGQVILRSASPGQAIDVGGGGSTFVIGLADAELDRIATPSLTIGSTTAGDITVSSSISPAAVTNLSLLSGDNVTVLGDISIPGALVISAGDDLVFGAVALGATSISVLVDQVGADGAVGGIANLSLITNAVTTTITGAADADRLIGQAGQDTIFGNGGNDTLDGRNGNDFLYGMDGNDSLLGGLGNDFMQGGNNDDTYSVDNAGDVVLELANQGYDSVYSLSHYTMGANIEALFLVGTNINGAGNGENNSIYGTAGINNLSGNGGNDTLRGYAGADVLNGGIGNDTMVGGLDNDTYFVDSATDVVVELAGNAEGANDVVNSTVTYWLSANVETLRLTGTDPINGTGNSAFNWIYGNTGNNGIRGGGSSDFMSGGGGIDTFVLAKGETQGDVISDFDGLGAAAGDRLLLSGWGAGATVTSMGGNNWLINSTLGNEYFTLANGYALHASDFSFV